MRTRVLWILLKCTALSLALTLGVVFLSLGLLYQYFWVAGLLVAILITKRQWSGKSRAPLLVLSVASYAGAWLVWMLLAMYPVPETRSMRWRDLGSVNEYRTHEIHLEYVGFYGHYQVVFSDELADYLQGHPPTIDVRFDRYYTFGFPAGFHSLRAFGELEQWTSPSNFYRRTNGTPGPWE